MEATHAGEWPKVVLDGAAWAVALAQPGSGLLHLAFEERIRLVVSQPIIEDLARHLGPEPAAEAPEDPEIAEALAHYSGDEDLLPPLPMLDGVYGGVVVAEPPAWVRRAVGAVVPEPALPAVAAAAHAGAAFLVSGDQEHLLSHRADIEAQFGFRVGTAEELLPAIREAAPEVMRPTRGRRAVRPATAPF